MQVGENAVHVLSRLLNSCLSFAPSRNRDTDHVQTFWEKYCSHDRVTVKGNDIIIYYLPVRVLSGMSLMLAASVTNGKINHALLVTSFFQKRVDGILTFLSAVFREWIFSSVLSLDLHETDSAECE